MSNITKKAMAQSLKKMLIVKELDKITITDITNYCGINRQTFYYHFKDIYDLLEWIFANEVVEKIEKETTIETWQENFKYVLDYMLKNKKFIIKTYNSLSRKTLLDFLFNQYNKIFIEIVNNLSQNYNITNENNTLENTNSNSSQNNDILENTNSNTSENNGLENTNSNTSESNTTENITSSKNEMTSK